MPSVISSHLHCKFSAWHINYAFEIGPWNWVNTTPNLLTKLPILYLINYHDRRQGIPGIQTEPIQSSERTSSEKIHWVQSHKSDFHPGQFFYRHFLEAVVGLMRIFGR